MRLTPEIIATFVGGQIEIQNVCEEYIYRGEIKTATIEGGDLKITMTWVAKGEGFPPVPMRWVADDPRDYVASLDIYNVSDIGDGRISMFSSITGETVVFFPLGESKLDPAKVEGLHLTA